jgi:glycosyltransferase involved in cell wall biosynthesis
MKVYYECRPIMSRAMHKIRQAIVDRAPSEIELVRDLAQADIQFVEAIGADAIAEAVAPNVVYLQYCLESAGGTREQWRDAFKKAALVVSYLDVTGYLGASDFNVLRAPLGVADAFRNCPNWERKNRTFGISTSGYVAIPPGEAVRAVYEAASSMGMRTFHLGPERPEGIGRTRPNLWTARTGMTDETLADIFSHCGFVSGLRWVEGFELPVVEGLLCGARPICFDLPCYRHWFDGLAHFVPADPTRLHRELTGIFDTQRVEVSRDEREQVLETFDWNRIAPEIWGHIQAAVKTEAWV